MASSQASTSYLASAAAPLPALMASKQHSSPSNTRRRASGRTSPRRSPAGILTSLAVGIVAIATVLSPQQAQAANFTQLTGTWASGSGKVITGLDFFNPISQNFTIPTSGGVSYSFVEDTPGGGHFETSTFTFTSNPTSNRCFTAALTWQHGTFTNNANGSLSLKPFAVDGIVQVMDPCAATSVAQYSYNQFELIPYWYNYQEASTGFANIDGSAWALQMYDNNGTGYSGTPKSPMYLVARPPNMIATEQLHEEMLNAAGASYD